MNAMTSMIEPSQYPMGATAETVADPLFAQRAIRAAAEGMGILPGTVTGPSRKPFIVHSRWAVMVALRRRGVSLPGIARRLRLRCHTTVVHGLTMAPYLAQRDPEFAALLAKVEAA